MRSTLPLKLARAAVRATNGGARSRAIAKLAGFGVAAGLACVPAAAQTKIAPDCIIDFALTAAGQTQGGVGSCGDNKLGVVQWTLWYKATGFSALSLRVESASDSGGSPGSWGAFGGTVTSGVNPNTATTEASTQFTGFEPWVRVALTSKTGTGSATGQLYGCRQPGCSGGVAVSVGPSGPAGGDLCGTYPDPTVCKVNGTPYGTGAAHQVPVDGVYKTLPNCPADALAFTQGTDTFGCNVIPTALPPSGTAGGDLSGTYPNPGVAKVNGTAYGSSPAAHQVPIVGVYKTLPNCPADALGFTQSTDTFGCNTIPTALPPSGTAGGDLSGTYPNPGVAKVNGTAYGSSPAAHQVPIVGVYKTIPDCPTDALGFTQSTDTFGCNAIGTGGVTPAGTFYLTSGGNAWGPVFPVTPPNTVSFSWRNQGSATETALGNALFLSTVANSSNDVKGREIVLPARPVSIAGFFLQQMVNSQFGACGLYFADNATGKLTTFGISSISSVLNWRVDHWTNVSTIAGNVFSAGVAATGTITMKVQDTGTNHVFYISSNGGQSFLQVFSESRTVFLANPDRVGYFCNSANATFAIGTTLLSWAQGT